MTAIAFRSDGLWLLFADGEEVGPFEQLAAAEAWLDCIDELQRTT